MDYHSTCNKLDFYLVSKKIEKKLRSDIGKHHLKHIKFYRDIPSLKRELELVSEMSRLIINRGKFHFGGSPELMYQI